jgi:hypothetical protein
LLACGPAIDSVDQTVKRKLSAYGDEDHRIEPWCSGPPGRARWGH